MGTEWRRWGGESKDFSNIMDSGLDASSASSRGTRECISSGLMDLRTLNFSCRWFFLLPVPVFASCISGGVAGALAGEDQGKQVIEPLSCGLPRLQASFVCLSFSKSSLFIHQASWHFCLTSLCWDALLLNSEMILEHQLASLGPISLQGSIPWHSVKTGL